MLVIERNQVDPKDCWNVDSLFPSLEKWKEKFKELVPVETVPRWPAIHHFKGSLKEGAHLLKQCLESILDTSRQLSTLYTYAHLRHDEDITQDEYKSIYTQITFILHHFHQECSWFEPELLSLSDEIMASYLSSPILADYQFYLEKIVRLKKYVLAPELENLLALAGNALQTAHKTFSAINDADLKFGTVVDSQGEAKELTHGSYALFLRSRDRVLRENAFKSMHRHYTEFENTLCELINGQVQAHLFEARARGYTSCLEAALFPKNIDVEVYQALIEAVHNKIGSLHRYLALRKKILKVEELHLYDLYVPLTPQFDLELSYLEAEEAVIDSVAPLGQEYQDTLRKGLKEEKWVDRFENKNKRSGAYSSGCYDSMPYILMNYKNLLRDVFTLAHEAGHSMHSWLSHQHQPYHYADYPIFLAEVASTFNEELLTQLFLKKAKTQEEKIFLINQKIEDIRTTLFRQTLFAEFELTLHTLAEQGIPLTPKLLKEKFIELNRFYFGKETVVDEEIAIEWARIPHFYYNFYVFQYATGISAALALADQVTKGIAKETGTDQALACEAYLSFLKGGSSKYPIELLKKAGVDMRSPLPVQAAIAKFDALLDQLEQLLADE